MSGPTEVDSETLSKERSNYYDKWHSFAKEEVEKTKAELEEEKLRADEELGLNKGPKSQAEKEDLDKREALKEAKKKWEDKELADAAKKFTVKDLKDSNKVLDSVKLHWKPVIEIKDCKNCKLKIPHDLKHRLVKVFISHCQNCEFDFEISSVTQHVEVQRAKNCIFRIKAKTATVQLDLCEGISVDYAAGMFDGEKVRIYHAGVKNLTVTTHENLKAHNHCFSSALENDDDEDHKTEVQFITHRKNGEIVTERVIRDAGNLPATSDEITEKELSVKTILREAELKKLGGNEAFKEKNYAQAAVFYTQSLDLLGTAKQKESVEASQDFSHILLANRAFCWQKLGHHERAEEDARECINLDPSFTKGYFRLGLALHAQEKYFEAVPVLGEALKLEPKNEQIKQALGFAEMQMRKMMRGRDD